MFLYLTNFFLTLFTLIIYLFIHSRVMIRVSSFYADILYTSHSKIIDLTVYYWHTILVLVITTAYKTYCRSCWTLKVF